jgi:pimeloyl-ACP methyl ester carboxylesterase
LNWRHIQEEVSGFARTISYDRAGLGWSDAPRTERTPVNVAAELQQMLERAGVRPPFILVGHSFGGLVMRRFALLYPGEVAGILLVDPMRCEEWPPLNPARQGNIDFGNRLIRYALPITQFGAARLAVTLLFCRAGKLSGRLAQVAVPDGRNTLNRLTAQASKMPRSAWPIMAAHWSRPSYYAGLLAHLQSIPQTVREMHIAEPIRSIPVTVITPHAAVPLNENQLEHIGSNVRQLIAEQSEHWIHLDEPALVIECIRDLAASTASVADCAIAKTRE